MVTLKLELLGSVDVLPTKMQLPNSANALPGRQETMPVPKTHFVLGQTLVGPFQQLQMDSIRHGVFLGCRAKVRQWTVSIQQQSVTPAAYRNPTYEEVCSGRTGHTETVLVVYDESVVTLAELLKMFWESHDPTQGMRQGNDMGTQYRSAVYTYDDDQAEVARASQALFQDALTASGYGQITTEIIASGPFYYAEHFHQQYLAKVPNGYCGLGGTGVECDISPLATMDITSAG